MYAKLPKRIYPLSSYFTDDSGKWIYTCIGHPDDLYPVDGEKSKFFMENRRIPYSDVCHAKLVTPTGFDDIGPTVCTTLAPGIYVTRRIYLYNSWTHRSHRIETPSSDGDQWTYQALQTNGTQAYRLEVKAWCRSDAKVGGVSVGVHLACYVSGSEYNLRYAYTDSSGSAGLRYSYSWRNGGRTVTKQDDSRIYSPDSWLSCLITPGVRFDTQHVAETVFNTYPSIIRQILNERVPGYSGFKFRYSSGYLPEGDWATPDCNFSTMFKFNEPGAIMQNVDDICFGKGFQAYWRNVGIQNAYLEAVRSVPRLNDNSISNLLEISAFIKKLVVDHKVEIPKSLGDAWLQYRYRYTTGKLDAAEAIKFVHRHMDMPSSGPWKCYGIHYVDYDGVTAQFRCSLLSKPKELDTMGRVWRALYTYGLSPSFYAVWDMIPYSFIVDWFLPIGDVLTAWDAEREYNGKYDITDINFSITYYQNTDLGLAKFYTRWHEGTPPSLQGRYFLEKEASSKVVGMRILDAGSLILGRKGG